MSDLNIDVLDHADPILGDHAGPFAQAAFAVENFAHTTQTRLNQASRCNHCQRAGDPVARHKVASEADEVLRILRGTSHRHHTKLAAAPGDQVLAAQGQQLMKWQDQVRDVLHRYGTR